MICIFCGQKKAPSKEHIIPEAICSKDGALITKNVCHECNQDLGSTIDSNFAKSTLIAMQRSCLGQTGYKGKSKPPFYHLKDLNGNQIKTKNNKLEVTPQVKQTGKNSFKITAGTEEEAQKIIKKMAKRRKQKYSINKLLKYTSNHPLISAESEYSSSDIEVEFLKIAFEYINLYYSDIYSKDPIGKELRRILNKFKCGKKANYSSYLVKLSNKYSYLENLSKSKNINYHSIFSINNSKNELFINILLFNGSFSYRVLVSNNGNLYPKLKERHTLIRY